MVKQNHERKIEYIDKLNVKTETKPCWKTWKPYFLKDIPMVAPELHLIENDKIVSENHKIAKTFNTYFELVTDLLNLFEWIGESVNSNDKIEQVKLNFPNIQVYLK